MARRKKYFKTKAKAVAFRKTWKRTLVTEPEASEMKVFRYGARFFLGTSVEFDFVRFT